MLYRNCFRHLACAAALVLGLTFLSASCRAQAAGSGAEPAVVKPGRIMFEMDGVTEDIAREAMRLASHKLPIKTRFVKKDVEIEGEEE